MKKKNMLLTGISRIFCCYVLIMLFLTFPPARASAEKAPNTAYWVSLKDKITIEKLEQIALAPGQHTVIRLKAGVPVGKTLKAYSITVFYDPEIISVTEIKPSPDAPLPPLNIKHGRAGTVSANAFDVKGAEGGKTGRTVSMIDMTIKSVKSGKSEINVLFSNFGASSDDEFKPDILPVEVIVKE